MDPMLKLEERGDLVPRCPHCDELLDKLYFRQFRGFLGRKRKAYFCPHCHKLLGFAHR
jgi:uncharacterized protein with PIN domain